MPVSTTTQETRQGHFACFQQRSVHRRSCGSGDPARNVDISRWVKGQDVAAQNTREGHKRMLKRHIVCFQQRSVHRRSCGSGDPAESKADISRWVKGQVLAAQNTREGHKRMLKAMLVTLCAAAETVPLDGSRTTGDLAFRTSESIVVATQRGGRTRRFRKFRLISSTRVEFNHWQYQRTHTVDRISVLHEAPLACRFRISDSERTVLLEHVDTTVRVNDAWQLLEYVSKLILRSISL